MARFLQHQLILVAVLLIVAVAGATLSGSANGALPAALAAALVVYLGLLASRLAFLTRSAGKPDVSGVLLGSILRLAVPLAGVIVATSMKLPIVEKGFYGFVVLCFLAGLLVETLLLVRTLAPTATPTRPESPSSKPLT